MIMGTISFNLIVSEYAMYLFQFRVKRRLNLCLELKDYHLQFYLD